LKKYGQIFQLKKIIFGTKTNIDQSIKAFKKSLLRGFFFNYF
jgi:hypothetical protein